MDTLGRQDRKTRTGKRDKSFHLIERDFKIFEWVGRYRYARKDFIHRAVGGSEYTLTQRLKVLFREGYLWRPEAQWHHRNCMYNYAWYQLEPKARKEIADPRTVTQIDGHSNFMHDAYGVCNSLASIELGAKENGYTVITWQDVLDRVQSPTKRPFDLPTLVQGKDTHARPDGYIGLVKGTVASHFFLEIERGNGVERRTFQLSSFAKKLEAYKYISDHKIYKEKLGLANMRVLVVTTSEKRMHTMMKLVEDTIGASRVFLFAYVDGLGFEIKKPEPYPDLFMMQWQRAGCEPCRLTDGIDAVTPGN
jgi:hypothetical protein